MKGHLIKWAENFTEPRHRGREMEVKKREQEEMRKREIKRE